jgi:glycosyltransferase involved in cell wall biosynthesis
MPRFSVIIPAYNRAQYIAATLATLRAQEFGDCEVIVVDDGSTDGTLEILARHKSWVRLFQQKNSGPGMARNLGVQHATGEYLAFLDSDDLWFPWTLGTYEAIIQRCQRPAFLAGKPLRFREENELQITGAGEPQTVSFPDYLASGDEWRWWGVSSFVIRRDAFEAAGKFTPQWVNGEDADLALRLGVAPGFVQVTNPATFAYRDHELNATKNLSKTLEGTWLGIHNERAGKYPGGGARARERRRILTRHIRPVTLECLREGLKSQAWALYRTTFAWHATLGRWKYLAGFPLQAVLGRP